MLSESARMNSAAEARFRIQEPCFYFPTVKVIALDMPSERVVRRVATGSWEHTTFLTAAMPSAELIDLNGIPRNLTDEVDEADLVVMVATPGGRAHAALNIGEACSLRRVMTTGIRSDMPSERVVRRVATGSWEHTTFLTAAMPSAELIDLNGIPRNLTDEVDEADLVVMVATPGGRAHAALNIGEACSLRRVMTTGI